MSIESLLNPHVVAVVGASQKGGRGTQVIRNLKGAGFRGEIYAVNPRYKEVDGIRCFQTLSALPRTPDCVVVAVGADAACDVLDEAYQFGTRGAVVLAAGFGEGGHGEGRVGRLRSLALQGMAICGPNSFGAINARSGAAMFSGPVPNPLKSGRIALISQSGGMGMNVFVPLMRERDLGFSHIVTCGNQVGTTLEDFIEYLLEDADNTLIAVILESLKKPEKLAALAEIAWRRGKTLLFHRIGRSSAGQVMAASHTGALATSATIFSAFMRRCGIVLIDSYDQFVEAIELFGIWRERPAAAEIIVVSGSGGGAAAAADALEESGVELAALSDSTKEAIEARLPEFASVTNPIDATGAIYDDPKLLSNLLTAVTCQDPKPLVAVNVNAPPTGVPVYRRVARDIANAANSSGCPMVAFQSSPLGPVDQEIVSCLHAAGVPLLFGVSNAMGALRYIAVQRRYRQRMNERERTSQRRERELVGRVYKPDIAANFLSIRTLLVEAGVDVTNAKLALCEEEAVAHFDEFGGAVAVKVELAGLMHKSDIGGVRLNCQSPEEVRQGVREVLSNVQRAGYAGARAVLIQPMVYPGVEVFAGVTRDPVLGTAITFGLGGIFIEVLSDTVTETAPIDPADAKTMIDALKGKSILYGARGRPRADVQALANLLSRFSHFAVEEGRVFKSIELNPIVVMPEGRGAVAVDIAAET